MSNLVGPIESIKMTTNSLELKFVLCFNGEITIFSLKLTDCQVKINYSSYCIKLS